MSVVKNEQGVFSLQPNILDDNGPHFDGSKLKIKSVQDAKMGKSVTFEYLYEYTRPDGSQEVKKDYLVISPPKGHAFICPFGIGRVKLDPTQGKLGDWGMALSEPNITCDDNEMEKLVEVKDESSGKKFFNFIPGNFKGMSAPFARYMKFIFDVERAIVLLTSHCSLTEPKAKFTSLRPVFKPLKNKEEVVTGYVFSLKLWFKGTGEPTGPDDKENVMYTQFYHKTSKPKPKPVKLGDTLPISKNMKCMLTISIPSMHINGDKVGTIRMNATKILAVEAGTMPGEQGETVYTEDIGDIKGSIPDKDEEEEEGGGFKRVRMDETSASASASHTDDYSMI